MSEIDQLPRLEDLDDPVPFVVGDDLVTAARARGTRLRRRRRVRQALVPVLVLVALVSGAAWLAHRVDEVHRVDVAAGVLAPVEGGRPFDVLVVGTDGPRGQAGVRTDAIMVVHVDQAADRVRILSLPRDLVFGSDDPRLDAIWGTDGPQALIQEVRDQLGIPIAHYVELDPQGLSALVDQVGGVRVATTSAVRDQPTGLALTAGCHTLDGHDALALARARHLQVQDAAGGWTELPGSDLQREADQQALVALMGRQVAALPLDTSSLTTLLGVFADHTTVDAGFSLHELADLATWAHGLSPNDVSSQTLPVTPYVRQGAEVLRPGGGAPTAVTDFLGRAPSTTGADPTDPPSGPVTVPPADAVSVFGPCP